MSPQTSPPPLPGAVSAPSDVLVRVRKRERDLVQACLARFGLTATLQTAAGASPRLALLDPEMMGVDADVRLARAAEAFPQTPMLLLSGPQDRVSLAALVEVPTVVAVIARDRKECAAELDEAFATLTAVGSPAHRTGVGRFVPADAPRLTRELVASLDRDALLEELETFLSSTGIRPRMAALARDAVEELVTNAIYDAPTDDSGRHIYADTDRRHVVFLPENARPRLEIAIHGTHIAATMSDPHGSLEVATVRRFLAQGLRGDFSDKAGGAGLGFARIYGLVDRLIVQVIPRIQTEISFTLEAGTARRDPASRPTGLLMWTATGNPAWTAPGPTSTMVS